MFWMILSNKFYSIKIILIVLNKEKRGFVMRITRIVEEHKMMNSKNVYAIRIFLGQIGFNVIINKNVEAQIGII